MLFGAGMAVRLDFPSWAGAGQGRAGGHIGSILVSGLPRVNRLCARLFPDHGTPDRRPFSVWLYKTDDGGFTTINGGILQLGDGFSNNGSVSGKIVNNATLTFANPNTQTYTSTISGSGSLT